MRDVNYGWLLRYLHANGASMFFVMVYIHIARGLYYGSYTQPRVLLWSVGVIIFFVMMGTAFIGDIAKNGYIHNHRVTNKEWDRITMKLGQEPKRIYWNLQNKDTQLKILENNRQKSGIYMIYNTSTSKVEELPEPESGSGNTLSYAEGIARPSRRGPGNTRKAGIADAVGNTRALPSRGKGAFGAWRYLRCPGIADVVGNIINDKCYIASAASNRINIRFRNHCIHGTGARLTNRAIKSYGLENFVFVIIEYYGGFLGKENLKKAHLNLLELETQWIQKVQPE
jgi:hypothetical protein